jgi:hypothetical protein
MYRAVGEVVDDLLLDRVQACPGFRLPHLGDELVALSLSHRLPLFMGRNLGFGRWVIW